MKRPLALLISTIFAAAAAAPSSATTNKFFFSDVDWNVPYSTTYSIVLAGAAGGDSVDDMSGTHVHAGGGGAVASYTIFLTQGTELDMILGRRGEDAPGGAGGGGASRMIGRPNIC